MKLKKLLVALALASSVSALAPALRAQDFVFTGPKDQYDAAPVLRYREIPAYPFDELRDEVKGRAVVAFTLDASGRLASATVQEATHPDFAAATIAMVEQWKFDPAQKAGRPVAASFTLTEEFHRFDRELVKRPVEDVLALARKHPEKIVKPKDLDAPLKLTASRSPAFPVSLHGKVATGTATVEVFIDEQGGVTAPHVVSASDPAFGWSAVQGVFAWEFAPPTRNGVPVVTRVRIPFDFADTPDAPAGAPAEKK